MNDLTPTTRVPQFKIGEVARQLGTTVRTLRYYEQQGLLTPPRTAKGTRRYSWWHVARFRAALLLTGLGIPLEDVVAATRARPGSRSGSVSSRKVLKALQGLRAIALRSAAARHPARRRAGRHLPRLHARTDQHDLPRLPVFDPLCRVAGAGAHLVGRRLAALPHRSGSHRVHREAGRIPRWRISTEPCALRTVNGNATTWSIATEERLRSGGWAVSGGDDKGPRPQATRARAAVLGWLLALISLSPHQLSAADGPQPPCSGAPPWPPYAEVDARPSVRAWSGEDLGRNDSWRPPPCIGWSPSEFSTLVALAARFHYEGGVEGLLGRFGAISDLTGVRYWSVQKGRWRGLIAEAYAVAGSVREVNGGKARADFSAAELRAAREVHFYQNDYGPAGGAIHRMRLLDAQPTRLVLAVENVSAVKMLFMTVLPPRALQSVYFLDLLEPDEGIWGYYSLTRGNIADLGGLLAARQTPSFVNRAAAVYRHIAGIPTDQEPPVAP
jgi:DNA-binding transcriptional MerR regulator